jgi:hypothetical protein
MAFFSTNSRDYASAIQSLVKPTYQSKYENLIENQMNKILNREDFSYDFNADPLYQNYKNQYTKLGKEAAINATAAASALTGGYGNSYAGTAASQANQQYLTQLNERIPELYNAAMQKYNMETENMYNQFGALQTEEGRQYGMYRDKVSDYYSDLSDLRNGFGTAQAQENADREFEYRQSRDAVSDSQWSQNYAYQQARDAISDSHWQQEFDTKNSQWQKEYELALKKARSGGSGGGTSKTGKYTTDKTWQGGLVQEGRKKVRFTQNEAETQVGKLDTKAEKEHLIDTWLDLGYISENDAAILMDKFKL